MTSFQDAPDEAMEMTKQWRLVLVLGPREFRAVTRQTLDYSSSRHNQPGRE